MITKKTCQKIWHCHREIEAGQLLLSEIENIIKANKEKRSEGLLQEGIKDVFGRDANLQLGVPTGENSHRIFQVSWELSLPIVNAHIANKQAALEELQQIAFVEINHPQVSA